MSLNKIVFKDGLTLDGLKIKGITKYELDGAVEEHTVLKLELYVDDSELFKEIEYEFEKTTEDANEPQEDWPTA